MNNDGNFNLENILIKIKVLGFSRIFLESGIKLITNFLNKDLVDDLKLFVSDKNLGGNGSGSIRKLSESFLRNKKKIMEKVNLSGDKLISYKLK